MSATLRAFTRPLLRAVHPDLFAHDHAAREVNARSLQLLNAVVDALDHGGVLPSELAASTAPRAERGTGCELAFHVLPSGDRVSTTLRLPASMLRPAARGGGGLEPQAPALLATLVRRQLRPLLRRAGVGGSDEREDAAAAARPPPPRDGAPSRPASRPAADVWDDLAPRPPPESEAAPRPRRKKWLRKEVEWLVDGAGSGPLDERTLAPDEIAQLRALERHHWPLADAPPPRAALLAGRLLEMAATAGAAPRALQQTLFTQALERGARPGAELMGAVGRVTALLCSGRVLVGRGVGLEAEARALTRLGGALLDHRNALALDDDERWRRAVLVLDATPGCWDVLDAGEDAAREDAFRSLWREELGAARADGARRVLTLRVPLEFRPVALVRFLQEHVLEYGGELREQLDPRKVG